jgi:predicted Fe-Mo cluster-binding NifX family protein
MVKPLSSKSLPIHKQSPLEHGTRRALFEGMNTTIAIPVWEDRVSTTLDFAQAMLVVVAEGRRDVSRREVRFSATTPAGTVHTLQELGADILLCGAVSAPLARALTEAGIRVVPYVAGDVDRVLAAFLCGRIDDPRYLQPGCRPGVRRRWRHRCGCGPC